MFVLNVPGAQATHVVDLGAPEYVPFKHGTHVEVVTEYPPAEQLRQVLCAGPVLKVPMSQGTHAVAWVELLAVPVVHTEHVDCPTVDANEPGWQATHAVTPVVFATVPNPHAAHVLTGPLEK
jgi:hypothetical protein